MRSLPHLAAPSFTEGEAASSEVVSSHDEVVVADAVAGFLAGGLLAGEPCIVLAADCTAALLRARLSALGIDAQTAIDHGHLRFIDAHALLATLLVDGMLDRERFNRHVRAPLEQAGAGGKRVRVHAEMVDILRARACESAALALEEMWNELSTGSRISLLRAHTTGKRSRMPALQQPLARQGAVEAELRERNEELNELLDKLVDGLQWLAPDGAILSANAAQLALLGYSREEYVGRNIGQFHLDREMIAGILDRLAHNETVRDAEARLRCKDGSIKHVRVSFNALFRDGKLVRTACVTHDVTAERLAREETTRLLDALVEAARAKDEFIAMLSHELRGPLAPIRSALQLMQLRGDTGVTREREIAERQVGNVVRLVDDLLDASRIAAGKIELHPEILDMADVIEMALEMAAPVLDARGHTVHVRAMQGAAFVQGDAVRLAQVISNLLSNAAKYTERGGRVQVDLRVNREEVVISVQDTGIGIEPVCSPISLDAESRVGTASEG